MGWKNSSFRDPIIEKMRKSYSPSETLASAVLYVEYLKNSMEERKNALTLLEKPFSDRDANASERQQINRALDRISEQSRMIEAALHGKHSGINTKRKATPQEAAMMRGAATAAGETISFVASKKRQRIDQSSNSSLFTEPALDVGAEAKHVGIVNALIREAALEAYKGAEFSFDFLKRVGRGDGKAKKEFIETLQTYFPVTRTGGDLGVNYLLGAQKKGKSVILKLLRHLQLHGDTNIRDFVQKAVREHLTHTVTTSFELLGKDGYRASLMDCMGLGSSAAQGSIELDTKYETVEEYLTALCEGARRLEGFQTAIQEDLRGNPIIVIEQLDDVAKEMIAKAKARSGTGSVTVVHNLRFASKKDIEAYQRDLLYKQSLPYVALQKCWVKIENESYAERHYVIGPLNTDDKDLFNSNILALKTILSTISTILPSSNLGLLVNAVETAYARAYSAPDTFNVRSKASDGYPFMKTTAQDGSPSYILSLYDIDQTSAPIVAFGVDYKKDLQCTATFKSHSGEMTTATFTFELDSSLKAKVRSLAEHFNSRRDLRIESDGTIIIKLPKPETLREVQVPVSRPFPLRGWNATSLDVSTDFQKVALNVPAKVEDILRSGITIKGAMPTDTNPVITVAVEGNYNDGKTTLIAKLLGLESAGDEGNMVHTEGVTSFIGKIGKKLVDVRDTMGKLSGGLQSGASGATDEDVRRQQNAIAGAVDSQAVDMTIFVTKAFDNVTIKQLLEGGYDPTRTVVLHNMKDFVTEGTSGTYKQRIKDFWQSVNDHLVSADGFADKIDEDDWCVLRLPNGMTHVFMKYFNLDQDQSFNNKTIQMLRHAITHTIPRTQRTYAQSVDEAVDAMVRRAFALPVGSTISVNKSGTQFIPVIMRGDGRSEAPTAMTPPQNAFETAGAVKDASYTIGRKRMEKIDPYGEIVVFPVSVPLPFLPFAEQNSITVTGEGRDIEIHYTVPAAHIDSFTNLPRGCSAKREGNAIFFEYQHKLFLEDKQEIERILLESKVVAGGNLSFIAYPYEQRVN